MAGELQLLQESLKPYTLKEIDENHFEVYIGEEKLADVKRATDPSYKRIYKRWIVTRIDGMRYRGTTFATLDEAAQNMYDSCNGDIANIEKWKKEAEELNN